MIRAALGFGRDVLRTFTWQKVLLAQLLVGMLDVFALLLFVYQFTTPPTFAWSRLVIEETMAFCILLAVLIADQAVARGAPRFRAYSLAIMIASVFSTVAQHQIRGWLGVYTIADQPGSDPAGSLSQMIYAGCDTLTYGVLFIFVYLDYRRRERLLHRVRAAELERARREQTHRAFAARGLADGRRRRRAARDTRRPATRFRGESRRRRCAARCRHRKPAQ